MILQRSIDLYHWIGHNAAFVILWGVVLLCLCCILAILVEGFRVWRQHEIEKAERALVERSRRLAAAHRLPKSMSESASQGFDRSRNRMVS